MKRILVVFMIMMLGIPSTLAGVAISGSAQADGPDLSVAENSSIDCDELQIFGVPMVPPSVGDVECGQLSVPENWLQPEGRTITISYVVLKSTSPNPLPDPVVYLEGGPGGSALSGVGFYADLFAPHRASRDVVLFDQRGTQFSSKLDCSLVDVEGIVGDAESLDELIEDDDEAAVDDDEEQQVDLRPSYDPEELMTIARQETGDETAACVRELLGQGVDLRQYNSVASARDTVALVQSLGYETYNLYGISYGTRLALVIMREFPESGLRSVVLDSTFPPETKGFELYPSEAHEVITQVFADCALDPICSEAYPNLKQRFIALLDTLQSQPVTDDAGISVSAVDVVDLMRAIPSTVDIAPLVPRLIHDLENGETDTYIHIVSTLLDDSGDADVAGDDEQEPQGTPEDAVPADNGSSATPAEEPAGLDPSESPSVIFIDAVAELALVAPPPLRTQIPLLLAILTELPPTRENLQSFVETAFGEGVFAPVRDPLLSFIEQMSDEDIEDIYLTLSASIDDLQMLFSDWSDPMFNSVECNEEVPFESFSQTVTNLEALEISEVAYDVPLTIARIFAVCEQWPSGRALEVENQSVESDIPTLILAGSYDFQTPVSWNKQAFVHLQNAYFSEFPMAGHGVILFSDCAADVSVQFIGDPSVEPDNSCKADLGPAWVLPDAQLDASD